MTGLEEPTLQFVAALYEHYGPNLGFSAAAVLGVKRLSHLAPVKSELRLDEWFASCGPIDPFVITALEYRDGAKRRLWRINGDEEHREDRPQSSQEAV